MFNIVRNKCIVNDELGFLSAGTLITCLTCIQEDATFHKYPLKEVRLAHRKEGKSSEKRFKKFCPRFTRLTHGDPSHYERGRSKYNKKANRLWRIVDNTGRRYLASRRCGYFSNERGIVSGVEGLSWFFSLFFNFPSFFLLILPRLLTLLLSRGSKLTDTLSEILRYWPHGSCSVEDGRKWRRHGIINFSTRPKEHRSPTRDEFRVLLRRWKIMRKMKRSCILSLERNIYIYIYYLRYIYELKV